MITVSENAKEAIKLALTMVIVFFIGLRMAWMNPYWAAFAVMVVSLPTAGQSLNKGAERLLGTIPGALLALFFLGLFPQDRWLFLLSVSLYVGFATYMMTGTKLSYFWKLTALVCLIVAEAGPASSAEAFEKAWARTIETGMGVAVYSLVCVFLWPRTNLGTLRTVSAKLLETQAQTCQASFKVMLDKESAGDGNQLPELHKQEVQLLGQFSAALQAAGAESYAVHSQKQVWDRLHGLTAGLMTALDAWRLMLVDVQRVDFAKALPDLEALDAEIAWRFDQIQGLSAGRTPDRDPRAVKLRTDHDVIRALPHLDRAAVAVARTQLLKIESLTRELFGTVGSLVDSERETKKPAERATGSPRRWQPPTFDPDRVRASIMVMATMWVGFVMAVWFNTPQGVDIVQLGATFAFIVALTPQLEFSKMIPIFGVAFPSSLAIYVLILPRLSGFTELAVLIFVYMFLVGYFFQGMYRTFGIAAFLIMVKIQNQQSYNFAAEANTLVYMFLGVFLVVACSMIMMSFRPEKKFLRLLSRFFRAGEYLIPRLAGDGAHRPGVVERWKSAYYHRELDTLPAKLEAWGKFVDHKKFPGGSPEQVQQLVASVQSLGYRVDELTDAGRSPQAGLLVREMLDDVRSWREAIRHTFQGWAEAPEVQPAGDVQQQFDAGLARLEAKIARTLEQADQSELKATDYENFYRLLGSYRGLAQAAVAYVGVARSIDLTRWREESF